MSKLIDSIVETVQEIRDELEEMSPSFFNGDTTIYADLPACANFQELQEVLRCNLDYMQNKIPGGRVDSFEIFDSNRKTLAYFYPYDYRQENPGCDPRCLYRIGIDKLDPKLDVTKVHRVKVMVFDSLDD